MEYALNPETLIYLDVDVPDERRAMASMLTPPAYLGGALLPPKQSRRITLFTSAENSIATAVTGANTAMVNDILSPFIGSVAAQAKFASGASSRRLFFSNFNTALPVDLTGKVIATSAKYVLGSGYPTEYRVRLYSSGSPSAPAAAYHTFNFLPDTSASVLRGAGNWTRMSASISRFTTVGGGANLAAITYAAIEVAMSNTATPPTISLGDISAYPSALKRGAVVVDFDGIYRSQWNNAFPILARNSIPATFRPANAASTLKSEPLPVFTQARISTVTASPTAPLIRITLVDPTSITDGALVAVAGIVGTTDNGVSLAATSVYALTKVSSTVFDLQGSTFTGTDATTYAYANFSVQAITGATLDPNSANTLLTVAAPGVFKTGHLVCVLGVGGVTGLQTANRYGVTEVDGSTTSLVINLAFAGSYTSGGYLISATTAGTTYINLDNLEQLQYTHGCQVGAYTGRSNNKVDYINLDLDAITQDFQKHQLYLQSRGFKGLADGVYFNDTTATDPVYQYMRRQYRSLRLYLGNAPTYSGETLPVGDAQQVRSYGVFAGTSAATILALVDSCIANRDLCILVFHEVDRVPQLFSNAANFLVYNLDDFNTVMTGIASRRDSGTLDCLTLEQAFAVSNAQPLELAGSVTVTAAYAIKVTDTVVLADATIATFAVTPPAVAAGARATYTVKKIDASANAVTVPGPDGGTVTLSARYNSVTFTSDGTAWYVTGKV